MLWSRQVLEWTDDHERTLWSPEVSEHGPGTILRDFEALLSFVRVRDLSLVFIPADRPYAGRQRSWALTARTAQGQDRGK